MKVNHRELAFSQYKTLNILFQYSTLSTFKTRWLFYTREAETGRILIYVYDGQRSNEQRIFVKPKVKKKYYKQSNNNLGPH